MPRMLQAPSPLLGEKVGMRGLRTIDGIETPEPPHPNPLPAEERERAARRDSVASTSSEHALSSGSLLLSAGWVERAALDPG
jgi:hypothetical protein